MKKLSILLLCDDRPGNANTIIDHIEAFSLYSRHRVRTFNPAGMRRSLALDLNEFDVVVIHYSLVLSHERHVSKGFREKLRRYSGLKVQFMQDEYRWVDRATNASREIGVDVLFTSAPEPAAGQLYDARLPGVRRVQTLTGYVPERLKQVPRKPLEQRTFDVGYRGRDLPYWLGRLTQEKQWIGQGFQGRAGQYGLRTDISWREEDRLYGTRWTSFLADCRATLGSGSGASIADFDGRVERAVRAYLRVHPGASFEEVHGAVLAPYEGNVVVNVVSPRVFEAAALGTGLIMFPGDYSGVVKAGEHYIALAKDFSNMDEVVDQLRDETFMRDMTSRVHQEVVESGRWSYETFINDFDRVVDEEADAVRDLSRARRHRLAKIERALWVPPFGARVARVALNAAAAIRGRDSPPRSEVESSAIVSKALIALRAVTGDPELRAIFLEGRSMGVHIEDLLEDMLELYVLRSAARGTLKTPAPFVFDVTFDPGIGALTLVSRPVEAGSEAPGQVPSAALDELRAGGVRAILWDHRAVGELVSLEGGLDVGVGVAGLKDFRLLAEIGQRRPDLVERALAPVILDERAWPATVR